MAVVSVLSYRNKTRKRAKATARSALETGRELLSARARIKELEGEVAYYKQLAEQRHDLMTDIEIVARVSIDSVIKQLEEARREIAPFNKRVKE